MKRLGMAVLMLATSGCSSQFLENNAQGWREAECNKILDTPRRERCLKEARQSHKE
jgi:hypothetical protein